MNTNLTVDNHNRLTGCIIEKFNCSYESAVQKLSLLKLCIICGEKIKTSLSLQAALITAINTGKRCFLGGIDLHLPEGSILSLLPFNEYKTLNELAYLINPQITLNGEICDASFILTFGVEATSNEYSLEVICNSWQGGVKPKDFPIILEEDNFLPIGGIAAGAIGVGLAFFKASGINKQCSDFPSGISLWRPDLNWLDQNAKGNDIESLPKQFWLLGLGHLGQGYIWNLLFLPYNNTSEIKVVLQDFDKISEANYSAGVLTELHHCNQYKTRVCSNWLEKRGFDTIITERKFDANTKKTNEEPFVALCGFDNAEARINLENAGFDLIIEAALGGSLNLFDDIMIHTFPDATKSPKEIWDSSNKYEPQVNKEVLNQMNSLFQNEECGIIPLTISEKAISSSFVGVLTGALVIGELIRSANCENRYETIHVQVRNLNLHKAFLLKKYDTEISRNGVVTVFDSI